MTRMYLPKALALLFIGASTINSNSASFSFSEVEYLGSGDQVSVSVLFDFTDTPAFGGGFNVLYDPGALEFFRYTQNVNLPQDLLGAASPLGNLDSPGNYLNAGIGTFEFFTGINFAGAVGTFVFNLNGTGTNTICGGVLCLTPVASNPVFDLMGNDITAEVFANENTVVGGIPLPTPIPAAAWFLLSGLFALIGLSRKTGRY